MTPRQIACDQWIAVFTQLGISGVPSMQQLTDITSEDVRFIDPFNDLQGREAVQRLLQHTLEQVREVEFEVLDKAESAHATYLTWCMRGRVAIIGGWQVTGMSELRFDDSGKIQLHRDYWDAADQFYAHLPIIGWLLRRLRRMAAIE